MTSEFDVFTGKILSKSRSRGFCINFDEVARKKVWKKSVSLKIIREYIIVEGIVNTYLYY